MMLKISEIEAQIRLLEEAMQHLGPVLIGFVKKGRNKKPRKNGTVYVSREYHTFVGKGPGGKTISKRINAKLLPAVMKKVEAGKTHRQLAAEHEALSNMLAFAGIEKKNAASRNPSS